MNSAADDAMAERLRVALEAGSLSIAYQPKILLSTGNVTGVEAVSRWHDAELGAVSPEIFVPLAERCGMIDELTESVLRGAVRQWAVWRDQGIEVRLAINVSALCLRDVALPDRIQRLCMSEGMPCELLTVEVTESATQSMACLLDTLTRFRLKGISVSLDDFGTGYSSLVQLRQLPYSEIKIDRCFVADAAVSRESRLIVKAIVDLAHGMGLTATAEGVEDAETLALLRDFGCDEAQGFLIGRPMRGNDFVEWLLRSSRTAQPVSATAETAPDSGCAGEAGARQFASCESAA